MTEQLALYGGKKTKIVPFSEGKRFGAAELTQLSEALEQNTLFYWYGNKVKTMCAKFATMYGVKHCVATSSGTAAIHTALGALGITEGDEVITSPITDMGTIIGILYQNAIPVFADVEPHTYNIDPKSIEANITDKTKAILVVHLAGNPANMDAIMEIAERFHLYVIEDCAQAYLSYYRGKLVGSIGDIGCFSLNDYKHISAGDGGMCIMNDEALYHKALRFADKNYNRLAETKEEERSIPSIAPNYRMNELTAAVAIAQLDRLKWLCRTRNYFGDKITAGLRGLKGVYPHEVADGNQSSYWFYLFRLDEEALNVDTDTFVAALNAEGIPASRGYIPECVYAYDLFQNRSAYPNTHAPFDSAYYARYRSYPCGLCPTAEAVLKTSVRINVSEFYAEQDIDETIAAIRKVAAWFGGKENRDAN